MMKMFSFSFANSWLKNSFLIDSLTSTLDMNSLQKIAKEDLPQLRDIFKADWPLQVVSYALIEHFIDRFEKKPEWEEKVKFLSLGDSWKKTGTFAVVNENDLNIMFNTLEPAPYPILSRTLELLDYNQEMAFVSFRDVFRSVVFDVLRVHNLEATFDSGTRLIYMPREKFYLSGCPAIAKAPEGFHYAPLNASHVPKINSVWAQRSTTSEKFLSNLIEENPSTGAFKTDTGELAAWCVMLETGAMGNLQVDEKFLDCKIGIPTYMKQMETMLNLNREIIGHIVHQNLKAFGLAAIRGPNKWIGNNSWIGFKKKKPAALVPLWGHV